MKNKTKKILAVIILATMVLTIIPITSVFAETDVKPRFNISQNIIMKRDETSTLDVTVSEKLEFTSFIAEFDYDADAIEITGITKGEILPNGARLIPKYGANDEINGFAIDGAEKMSVDSGNIATINVKIKNNAEPDKYPIAWVRANLLNDDNEEVKITTDPGSIIIAGEGTNDEKPEFSMVYNNKMYPGEEQNISVKADNKMRIHYISAELAYDDSIKIVGITKGADVPENINIIPFYDKIISNKIIGFSMQSDDVINIDPNFELANIQIKASENDTQGKGEFQIDWNNILNQDWNEVIAENTTANIEIIPQVTTELKGIKFTDSRIEISRGTEFKMQYKLTPENISPLPKIEWITANKDVATVDSNGVVTAVGVGETTITAKVGEFTATAQIIVTEKPTIKPIIEIRRNKLVVGETEQIDVKIEPEEMAQNAEITYSSSDEKIATVDDKGIIRAITAGKVRINVYIDGNLEKTFDIEVTESTVPKTGDTQIELFAGMMIISVIGIAYTLKMKKK